MAKKNRSPTPPSAPPPSDLGRPHFAAPPEDVGLSLEELSEAYASLLSGGADPYAVPGAPGEVADDELGEGEFAGDEFGEGNAEDAEPVATEGGIAEQDERLPAATSTEVSPRTILEAMLFVGHPGHEPLTSRHVASLMRGVRPREIDDLVQELNEDNK